jgi:MFS family permease
MSAGNSQPIDNRSKYVRGRFGVLAVRDFGLFYAGYSTSLLGSAMAAVALTFAVLGSGDGVAGLGLVFAADTLPQVIFMLGGGVLADRIGRRPAMLGADAARFVVQGALAATLFATTPPLWLFVLLAAMLGTGDAFFSPALGGLIPALVPQDRLTEANALISVARSVTRIAGPALAGVLVAVARPASVIAIDAVTFGVSLLCLVGVTVPAVRRVARSPWQDLADGWRQFRSQTWLWVTTVQYSLFNLFTWAPFLLLGPVLARNYLGGASAWGTVIAANAAGAVLAGLLLTGRWRKPAAAGRRGPRRPLVVATIGSYGYAFPCLMLCLHAPLYWVAAGALLAGIGSAVSNTLWSTTMQLRVPQEMLARATAFSLTGSYALGAAGYTVIGLVATATGPGAVLGFATVYTVLSSSVVLSLRAIRADPGQVRPRSEQPAGPDLAAN